MCYLSRQTRTAMLDSINQEYIKTASAKGLKNSKIIFKHALRNALIPVITYLGPQIAFTLCGGLVVETGILYSGTGTLFYTGYPEPRLSADHGNYHFPGSIYYCHEPGGRPVLQTGRSAN